MKRDHFDLCLEPAELSRGCPSHQKPTRTLISHMAPWSRNMPEPIHRDNTVFFTPPSQPPTPPPPACPRPVRVNTGIPGPSFGPCPSSPWQLHPNPKPNPRYAAPDNVARVPRTHRLGQMALLANAAAEFHDPTTFQEAMASDFADEWHEACKYEMDALAKNGTWTLVDLPPGRKAIKSKWYSSGRPMAASRRASWPRVSPRSRE